MIGSNYLLDSNIVIEVFNGNKTIADKIDKLSGFQISAIVLGELYIGINRVDNKAKHLKLLTDFLKLCAVLTIDDATCIYYGEMIASLYKKGKPLPTNDVWIAASAKQHNLIIATRDNHFKEIDGVTVEYWIG